MLRYCEDEKNGVGFVAVNDLTGFPLNECDISVEDDDNPLLGDRDDPEEDGEEDSAGHGNERAPRC